MSGRERLILHYNQAAMWFSQQRYANAGSVLENLFAEIQKTEEWSGMRAALLLLEVYLHTYKAAAPGDAATRSVVSSANRVLEYLEKPSSFNDFDRILAIIEAVSFLARSATRPTASGTSATTPAALTFAEGSTADTRPTIVSDMPARLLAARLCASVWFRIFITKARLVLAGGDIRTAASQTTLALCKYTVELARAYAPLDRSRSTTDFDSHSWDSPTSTPAASATSKPYDDALRSSLASPADLPTDAAALASAMERAADDGDDETDDISKLERELEAPARLSPPSASLLPPLLRAEYLAMRASIELARRRLRRAQRLLDASLTDSASVPPPGSLLRVEGLLPSSLALTSPTAVAALRPAVGELDWPLPLAGLTTAEYLNNSAVLHLRSGKYHSASALLMRALAACSRYEVVSGAAVRTALLHKAAAAASTAAAAAPGDATAAAAAAAAAHASVIPLSTHLGAGPAGDARLGEGLSSPRVSPRREVLHNAGVVALLRRRPLEAFSHLRRALPLFRQRPRIWIRLAEACIMYHEQCVALSARGVKPMQIGAEWYPPQDSITSAPPALVIPGFTDAPTTAAAASTTSLTAAGSPAGDLCWAGAGIVRGVFGHGASQRMLLITDRLTCTEPPMPDQAALAGPHSSASSSGGIAAGLDGEPLSGAVEPPEEPFAPSLQYARACLENALCLLPPAASLAQPPPPIHGTATPGAAGPDATAALPEGGTDAATAAAAASNPAMVAAARAAALGWRTTRAAALTKLAYVCLLLEDYASALRYAGLVSPETMNPLDASGGASASAAAAAPNGAARMAMTRWSFLARQYAAEALCRLNRPADACALLDAPDVVSEAPRIPPLASSAGAGGAPSGVSSSPSAAQALGACALHVNRGIARLLAGRTDAVQESLAEALSINPLATEARLLSAYMSQLQMRYNETRMLLARGVASVGVAPSSASAAAAASGPMGGAAQGRK